MTIRKATAGDVPQITQIYAHIHDRERQRLCHTGWLPGIYPVEATARAALARDDLFVCESDGTILAAAILNQIPVDVYAGCPWRYAAVDSEVLVLHTLTVDPQAAGRGIGKAFVGFYERMAGACGCRVLRLDTNAKNTVARGLYRSLGYREAAIVPCVFHGIPGVELVLLEKEVPQALRTEG